MVTAQQSLVGWCEKKIASLKHSYSELAENVTIAIKNKWRSAALKRHRDLTAGRIVYYEKIKAALEAGYCIVPNFPVSVFAMRTNAEHPKKKTVIKVQQYEPWGNYSQSHGNLPIGEGAYKNPQPLIEATSKALPQIAGQPATKDKQWCVQATDWAEVEFPINMAKPQIMNATAGAMRKLIFDEFGVMPDPHPKKDPLIVGRIYAPRQGYSHPYVSFIIAWHLNVNSL